MLSWFLAWMGECVDPFAEQSEGTIMPSALSFAGHALGFQIRLPLYLARQFEFDTTIKLRYASMNWTDVMSSTVAQHSTTATNFLFTISTHFPTNSRIHIFVALGCSQVWAMVNEDLRPAVVEVLEKAFIQARRTSYTSGPLGIHGVSVELEWTDNFGGFWGSGSLSWLIILGGFRLRFQWVFWMPWASQPYDIWYFCWGWDRSKLVE